MNNHLEELYKRIFGHYPLVTMSEAEMCDAIAQSHEDLRTGEAIRLYDFASTLTEEELSDWVYTLDPANVEDGGGYLLVMQDRLRTKQHNRAFDHLKANPADVNLTPNNLALKIKVSRSVAKTALDFAKHDQSRADSDAATGGAK